MALIILEGLRATGWKVWCEGSTLIIVDRYGNPLVSCLPSLWSHLRVYEPALVSVLDAETDIVLAHVEELCGAGAGPDFP